MVIQALQLNYHHLLRHKATTTYNRLHIQTKYKRYKNKLKIKQDKQHKT